MKIQTMAKTCPGCDGRVKQVEVEEHALFRGVEVAYTATLHQCAECGLELAGIEEAAIMQERLADAYRKAVGLLGSEDIRRLRQEKGLSQQGLADALDVGVASIKRWETGVIQSKSMDTLLRSFLQANPCSEHTGNREFSIPRIRLVLEAFAGQLKRPLLKRDDRMLYAAKHLWYADMVAFRDLGHGMTGATYAALPMGPQLNNYRDLIDEILKADVTSAPPLSKSETAIIAAIVRTFPTNKSIYDASHREPIWQRCGTGANIPYSHAAELTEMCRCEELS
ncbi:MAG: helix-turn-helix domain-containing protein [Desulfomicrobium sp.]|nr:helix-turn-helix domain-containing protein [Desulfomicrobium sp.]MDP3429943.1 helix-turn-helix domain-containing protein [Desulfomicrobium sp.]